MFLGFEIVNVRRLILVVNPSFSTVPLDIGELVDGESVSPVNGGAVKLFGGGDCLLWCLVLDKGITG